MVAVHPDIWAVIGTSESAARYLALVPEGVTTIAANAAVRLFDRRRLDYYWLHDGTACRRHHDEAMAAQARGTKLVTLWRKSDRARSDRRLDGFDLLVSVDPVRRAPFERGELFQDMRLSGLYCLAFAINHGARVVLMLGMEGYQNHQAGKVTLIIRPITQAVIDACPDVRFVFLGSPRYRIAGPNLIIHEAPDEAAIYREMERHPAGDGS